MDWIFQTLVILHVIGATIWTGGHLVLSTTVLQKTLKLKDKNILLDFEEQYERIGMPALLSQIITGVILAIYYSNDFWIIFLMDNKIHTIITIKFILLIITSATAIHAKIKVLPSLSNDSLPYMGKHVYIITIVAVVYVIIGVLVRL